MMNPWIIIGWIVLTLMCLPLCGILLFLLIRGAVIFIILICTLLHIPCDKLYEFYKTLKID